MSLTEFQARRVRLGLPPPANPVNPVLIRRPPIIIAPPVEIIAPAFPDAPPLPRIVIAPDAPFVMPHKEYPARYPMDMADKAEAIVNGTCALFGYRFAEIMGFSKYEPLNHARHVIIWALTTHIPFSTKVTGRCLDRDHSTVVHARQKIAAYLRELRINTDDWREAVTALYIYGPPKRKPYNTNPRKPNGHFTAAV